MRGIGALLVAALGVAGCSVQVGDSAFRPKEDRETEERSYYAPPPHLSSAVFRPRPTRAEPVAGAEARLVSFEPDEADALRARLTAAGAVVHAWHGASGIALVQGDSEAFERVRSAPATTAVATGWASPDHVALPANELRPTWGAVRVAVVDARVGGDLAATVGAIVSAVDDGADAIELHLAGEVAAGAQPVWRRALAYADAHDVVIVRATTD